MAVNDFPNAEQLFALIGGGIEDAISDVGELEDRIGGSCELSSVRTSLNDAHRVLQQMKGDT